MIDVLWFRDSNRVFLSFAAVPVEVDPRHVHLRSHVEEFESRVAS